MKRHLLPSDTEQVRPEDIRPGDVLNAGFGFVKITRIEIGEHRTTYHYQDDYGPQSWSQHSANWPYRLIGGKWPE